MAHCAVFWPRTSNEHFASRISKSATCTSHDCSCSWLLSAAVLLRTHLVADCGRSLPSGCPQPGYRNRGARQLWQQLWSVTGSTLRARHLRPTGGCRFALLYFLTMADASQRTKARAVTCLAACNHTTVLWYFNIRQRTACPPSSCQHMWTGYGSLTVHRANKSQMCLSVCCFRLYSCNIGSSLTLLLCPGFNGRPHTWGLPQLVW